MQNQEPVQFQTLEEPQEPAKPTRKERKQRMKKKVVVVAIALLLFGAGFALGWYLMYRDNQALKKSADSTIADLHSQIANLNSQLTDQVNEPIGPKSDSQKEPTQETRDAIRSAMDTKDYAMFSELFADKVTYAVAASDGKGTHTASEAVKDLDYFKESQAPWNFELTQSEINSYKNQYYAQYFPTENSVVGKSADGAVVSFVFDENGKINALFMSISSEALTNP